MAERLIPLTPGRPHFRQRTTLDGVEYVLEFRWSMREERWYLDIRDVNGELLRGCIKVVANYPLLHSSGGHTGLPTGELVAMDQRVTPADPGLDELGGVVQLVYLEAEAA